MRNSTARNSTATYTSRPRSLPRRGNTPPPGRGNTPPPGRTSARASPSSPVKRTANKDRVATVVLPGDEDPAKILLSGKFTLTWESDGTEHHVNKFLERPVRHVIDSSLTLPTLYLHFLDGEFFSKAHECDPVLRAGNDNSEVRIVLPKKYVNSDKDSCLIGDIRKHLSTVISFLKEQGQMQISACKTLAGEQSAKTCPDRLAFSLLTARPKAPISLPKPIFGIPQEAELYLFVFNHASVQYMDENERLAFEVCIEELPHHGDEFRKLSVFLKVFYEGAFAYNKKTYVAADKKGYIPETVGIGCMSVQPFFPKQGGIATGYPYLLEPRFLTFADSIPVTIRTISRMSDRHHRYGLCFTRCVSIWASETFETTGALEFCSILPNGGFFYLPGTLSRYRQLGGLVYAFGDDRQAFETPSAGLHDVAAAKSGALVSAPVENWENDKTSDRVCVICLDADAVMATLPCGHLSYCQSCVELARSRNCPVCRGNVESIVHIFY